MKTAIRTSAAVVAGLLMAFLLVVAVELFSAVVHPLPEDFGGTKEEMCLHVERYPSWVLAVVVPLWAAAAFVGVRVAQKVGNVISSAIVGLLVVAALVLNLSMLPYPIWFKVANLVAIPVAIVIGIRSARQKRSVPQIAPAAPE